jgi:CheY-like chemotaxis protein
MDAGTCDKLFDPYFIRENETRDSGIGLCVVHGIVESHGGRIQVESKKDRGNRFDLFFPVYNKINSLPDMAAVLETAETTQDLIRTGSERILLVDDDKKVADMQCFMLEKLGYTVVSFLDPVKAITYFKANVRDLDLVITDLTMSGLNGIEFSNHVHLIQPGFPVILCSGLSEPVTRSKLESAAVQGFLKKPISVHELSRILVQVLDRPV